MTDQAQDRRALPRSVVSALDLKTPESARAMMTANLAKVRGNQRMTVMSNPTVNSVFEAFIEADKAMKELPAIREELAQVRADHQTLIDINDGVMAKLSARETELETLRHSLAAREAELAHATFRADAVEAKHRALRSILGGDDSAVLALDGALSGDQSEQNPTATTAQNATSHNADAAGDANSQTHSDLDHPQSPGPTGSPSSESGLESPGQSDVDPTLDHPNTGDGTMAQTQTTSPTPATNGTSPAPQPENPTSVPGPSSNPSVDAGESGMFIGGSASPSPSASPPLAFTGQPSTRKPDGMEWGYWIVNGGEAPVWMGPLHESELREQYAHWAGHAKAAAE